MAAASSSSSGSRRYDVFPSFSGEDVRKGFLSYLLKEFDRRSINSFIDNGIERSRPIGPELLSAIREARISIVIFSKNYAASTWCLNELLEIHRSSKELKQMVIPVFYYVDPSDVRKQTGEFGKFFEETCKGKPEDHIQKWMQALTDIANLAGEDLRNGPNEAHMVEKIVNDVSNKLLPPSNGFGDFVGIEAHIEAVKSILCLESEEPRMIGIRGQSGIGKSTLGRALFSHLSPDFHFRNFTTDKPMDKDVSGMKLFWEKEFLSEILDRDIKENRLGMVEPMLKDKKVLIVLDDVVNLEFLETLVGKTEWFGPRSRIIVITQDRHLLKAHKIDLLYEVKIPDKDIALKMLCRSAFGENSPPDAFKELAVKVAKVAGNLPLGLRVLGSSLKGRTKEEWMELLPRLETDLDRESAMKTLRVGYNRLNEKEQEIFLYIASLFNGRSVKCFNDFFGDDKGRLERLAEKSLIRITQSKKSGWRRHILPDTGEIREMHNLLEEVVREIDGEQSKSRFEKRRILTDATEIEDVLTDQRLGEGRRRNEEIVEMHNLLEKLGREIDREESKNNYGKRRFLSDAKEIEDVLTNQTGTETILGIFFDELKSHIPIDEQSFESMYNLQFLQIYNPYHLLPNAHSLRLPNTRLRLPKGLNYLPPKLKYLIWDHCPLKCLPSNFKAEFLVELSMWESKLEKLWEGTPQLGSLKTIRMSFSENLKEIPDLSKAINLVRVDFGRCINLESFPNPLNWESLEYLNLKGCNSLKNFPQIKMESLPHGIEIHVYDCLWNKNLPGRDYLDCLRKCNPVQFLPEHIVHLEVKGTTMEKLWEGVQSLGRLGWMNLSYSKNLKEIPDLSKATNLKVLFLSKCKSLVRLPSTIRNLQKLELLVMVKCTRLEVLPVDVNLSSLKTLYLIGCSKLTSFPQISRSIEELYLDHTAIEEVLCCIEKFRRLTKLSMRHCSKLKNISPNIFRLTNLKQVDFTDCEGIIITALSDSMVATIEDSYENIEKRNMVEQRRSSDGWYFNFQNCLKLDNDARKLIIQSSLKWTVILPGGEVPIYYNHRAFGNSLTVTLRQSSLSHNFLRFNVCVVVKPLTGYDKILHLHFRFNGVCYKHVVDVDMVRKWKTDHLVLCSFKIHTTGLPSILDFNDVEFKFKFQHGVFKFKDSSRWIKEVGIRVLNVYTSLDDRDGRSFETECNNQFGEKCDVKSSNKQMQMTLSEENFNLPCDQIVTDTGLIAPNLELPLGRGESSSVSSYPCLEEKAFCVDTMITEQQDAQIPVVDPDSDTEMFWSKEEKEKCMIQ